MLGQPEDGISERIPDVGRWELGEIYHLEKVRQRDTTSARRYRALGGRSSSALIKARAGSERGHLQQRYRGNQPQPM